jgi:3-methyladenine DNA glycosylase AlkD
MTATLVIDSLQLLADEEKSAFAQRYFKTGEGEYAQGDVFWGIKVPETKKVAKEYRLLPLEEVEKLIGNTVHEVRLCGWLIVVEQCKRAEAAEWEILINFYLTHLDFVNNWDLVDVSSHAILGKYLLAKPPRDILYTLANSDNLWKQRIAIVSTLAFIRKNDFTDTLTIAELLLGHQHDLIHKAVGWMLREIGKRDYACMMRFLKTHYAQLPRTTLRYAIEILPDDMRQKILQGGF